MSNRMQREYRNAACVGPSSAGRTPSLVGQVGDRSKPQRRTGACCCAPPNVATAIARCLGELDPQAEVLLDMVCPDCGTQWQALFDIASFLWTELDAWAHRTFIEVHRLAWTYGWREADILALSPLRRQRYLQMIG